MFPYETNAPFIRGTCERHSKYYSLPFGALREKTNSSGCGKQVFAGWRGALFFNSQQTTLFPSKRMLAGFILGAVFLPCWGLDIALSVSDVSLYSLSSFYAWWEAERLYADSFCELLCLIWVAQLDWLRSCLP